MLRKLIETVDRPLTWLISLSPDAKHPASRRQRLGIALLFAVLAFVGLANLLLIMHLPA